MRTHAARLLLAIVAAVLLLAVAGAPARAASSVDAIDEELFDLATDTPRRTTVHAWSVHPNQGRVVVYTVGPAQARAELLAAGVDITKVAFEAPRAGRRFVPLVCTRTSCQAESMRGGLSWHTSTGSCTTGFSAIRNGVAGFLSAGHCGKTGADAFLGDEAASVLYGTVLSSVETPTADALFVARDASFPGESRGWVYADPGNPAHVLTYRAIGTSYFEGRRSCFSARYSGLRCGHILDGSYTDTLQGLRDVVVVDGGMCGVPGDSGAPVFDSATALGIFSGVLVDPLDPDQRCREAVFHKLSHVEAETGAHVILEPR